MSVRNQFEIEMQQLKKEVMLLAKKVEQAFNKAITAVQEKNFSIMDEIIEDDEMINEMELQINEKATYLIAKQQPVASDLRKIIVSLKVSSDLERMGDLSVDIAKAGKRLLHSDPIDKFETVFLDMANKVKKMIQSVIIAFKDSNILDAQKIASADDEIDQAYGLFVKSLFNANIENKVEIEQVTQMAFISRYVERIADYCTNISEWIIYEVNGERIDLN